jgi:hypothetical protein
MSDFVPVYKSSFVIEEQGDLLRITTGMSQQEKVGVYVAMGFLALLAAVFLVSPVLVFAAQSLGDRIKAIGSFFGQCIVAVPLVILMGFVIFFGVRRTLKQVMEVTGTDIVIREGDHEFYRPRKYAAVYIKNLRGSTYPGRNEGAVKFDYGARTVSFGKSLQEAEANLIAQAIVRKFPALKEPASTNL